MTRGDKLNRFSKKLVKHPVLVCTNSMESRIKMNDWLGDAGLTVKVLDSFNEALKVAHQTLPHLIISDSRLPDGMLGKFLATLHGVNIAKRIPIMALVAKKTRDELRPLSDLGLAGFLLMPVERQSCIEAAETILDGMGNVSPFFLPASENRIEPDFSVNVDVRILGRTATHLIVESAVALDPTAQVTLTSKRYPGQPVELSSSSISEMNGKPVQMFPLDRIDAKGCNWLRSVPEVDVWMDQVAGASSVSEGLYHLPHTLLGVDEAGVVAGGSVAFPQGIRLGVEHSSLDKLFRELGRFTTINGSQQTGHEALWQTHFVPVDSMTSRLKFLTQLIKQLGSTNFFVASEGSGERELSDQQRKDIEELGAKGLMVAFIQSVNEVIEYYHGVLPIRGAPVRIDARCAQDGSLIGLCRLTGENSVGLISLTCDPDFLIPLASRSIGATRSAAKEDVNVQSQILRELCEQLFGRVAVYLQIKGNHFAVQDPEVLNPDQVPKIPAVRIPFKLGETRFSLEFNLHRKSA